MKASFIFNFKKSCFALYLITSFTFKSLAQQAIPKNYIGTTGNIELNRLAVGLGLEYERWLIIKKQFAIGAKGNYIFPSKTIKGLFSVGERFERNRQTQIMATSYLFTDPEKEINGFFFSLSAGVDFIKWEVEANDNSGNSYIKKVSETSPGFDISIGGQFKGKRISNRVAAGYQAFPGNKFNIYTTGNGVSLIYLKTSLGF